MPREIINDPDTEGLYVQVSWRKYDEIPDSTAPGHVQISTHTESAKSTVHEVLGEAAELIAFLTSVVASGEQLGEADQERVQAWHSRRVRAARELTGTYVTLRPEEARRLTRTLHKASRQAFTVEARAMALVR